MVPSSIRDKGPFQVLPAALHEQAGAVMSLPLAQTGLFLEQSLGIRGRGLPAGPWGSMVQELCHGKRGAGRGSVAGKASFQVGLS